MPSKDVSELELVDYMLKVGFVVPPGISIWQLLSNDCLLQKLAELAHSENNQAAQAILDAYTEHYLAGFSY